MTVWKFPLGDDVEQVLRVPEGARWLHPASQDGVFCLWALVDPEAELSERSLQIVGTGWNQAHATPADAAYLGSIHGVEGWMVFHIFDVTDCVV